MFEIARRNGVEIVYKTVKELKAAYDFADLQAFLYLYYAGMSVLLEEQDFYDLTSAYMAGAAERRGGAWHQFQDHHVLPASSR